MLHRRPQLADVARPLVTDHRLERLGGEITNRLGILTCKLPKKTQRQQRHIRRAVTQRRRPKLDHAQSEIKILAKLTRIDEFLQVFIGRSDNAHIDGECLAAAHPFECPFAQKTKQLHLRRLVDLANLIQKQRAALGLLEPADAALVRPSERPLFMAEQFALQQRWRQRRAMHRHHRLGRARTKLMNRLGQQLLAGTALALDQHRGPGRRDLPHDIHHPLHRLRFANDIFQPEFFVELLLERLVFALERAQLQRPGNARLEFVNLHSALGQIIIRALLECLHRQFLRAIGGHQDTDWRLGQGLGPGDQLHPVLIVRQPKIREQHIERLRLEQAGRRGRILCHVHLVAILQRCAQAVARRFFVVHDEQVWRHSSSVFTPSNLGMRSSFGSQMRKVVPLPPWLINSSRPSWSRTIRCTIIRPSPDPFFFVV